MDSKKLMRLSLVNFLLLLFGFVGFFGLLIHPVFVILFLFFPWALIAWVVAIYGISRVVKMREELSEVFFHGVVLVNLGTLTLYLFFFLLVNAGYFPAV